MTGWDRESGLEGSHRSVVLLIVVGLWATAGAEEQGAMSSDPVIRVDIAPTNVVVGRPVTVTFEIESVEGTRVYFPESPPVHPFRLLQHDREVPPVAGMGAVEVHRLTLLPLRVGTSVLSPIEVPYVTPAGEPRLTRTPEVRIQVAGTLGNEVNPELASPGEPIPVYVPNTVLIGTISGLGIALVAALCGALAYRAWRRWREAHRPPPPPRPPLEVALERLAALDAKALIEREEFQTLALQVTEIMKDFLGSTYGFPGTDLTTYEVMLQVRNRPLGRVTHPELEDFFGFCDLVKFAKWRPSPDEAAGMVPRARSLVERIGTPLGPVGTGGTA